MEKKVDNSPKLVHFTVIEGSDEEVRNLLIALKTLKNDLGLNYEFLVTNNRVELSSVKYLLDSLYKLYMNYKKIKMARTKEEVEATEDFEFKGNKNE